MSDLQQNVLYTVVSMSLGVWCRLLRYRDIFYTEKFRPSLIQALIRLSRWQQHQQQLLSLQLTAV